MLVLVLVVRCGGGSIDGLIDSSDLLPGIGCSVDYPVDKLTCHVLYRMVTSLCLTARGFIVVFANVLCVTARHWGFIFARFC